MLAVINNDGIMINVNVKNLFGIKDLFGILVIVNVNVIICVMWVNI